MSNDQIQKLKDGATIKHQVYEVVDEINNLGNNTMGYQTRLIPTEYLDDAGDVQFAIFETEIQAEIVLFQIINIMKQHNKIKKFTIIKTYSNAG